MKIEKIKENERETIAELLKEAYKEYLKHFCFMEEKLDEAKNEKEKQKILGDLYVSGNNFAASFLQSNGLTFKVVAYYQDLDGGYTFRCSHCHHAPTATYDDEWSFTPHCGTCGAEMSNAEELRKKQREKNGYREV